MVLNAVEADRIHFLTCQGQQQKSGSSHTEEDELVRTNMHAHTWAHERTHSQTKSAALHIEMIVSFSCQVGLFS